MKPNPISVFIWPTAIATAAAVGLTPAALAGFGTGTTGTWTSSHQSAATCGAARRQGHILAF